MGVELILSTDKLQSGFRAKYNSSVNQIITGFTDNDDGTATAALYGGSTLTIDFTDSFFTKAEVLALLAALVPVNPVERVEFTKTSDANGEVNLSAETTIPIAPFIMAYPTAGGMNLPVSFNPTTSIVYGLNPTTQYLIVFIG
jgi:hypothetical protein